MKETAVTDVYTSDFKKINKYYDHLSDDVKSQDIHLFRVEVKKIRAFIRLVNLHYGKLQELPKPIKKIYRSLGDIRSLQLFQKRIRSLSEDLLIECPDDYLRCLHKEEKSKTKKVKRKMRQTSIKDLEAKILSATALELNPEMKKEFVRNSVSRLQQLLSLPLYYDETLHDIRKVLKDLMYNYEFLESLIQKRFPANINELKSLKTLTDVLGSFHDLSSAFLFLNPMYSIRFSKENEVNILGELKMHLEIRKDRMLNNLNDLLAPLKRDL